MNGQQMQMMGGSGGASSKASAPAPSAPNDAAPVAMGMPGMQGMSADMAMNPMAAMMMPMMMNPMMMMNPQMGMMMNPMMAMMNPQMGQMGMMAGQPAAASAVAAEPAQKANIDPKIAQLCKEFGVDLPTSQVLHQAMLQSEDFDEDLQALRLLMKRDTDKNKKPSEAMRSQVRSIKSGRFPGKAILDPEIWSFATKYDLDDRVLGKLIEMMEARKASAKQDLRALDDRLGQGDGPAGLGLLVRLIEGLEENGRLPSPPRRFGGSGAFRPTGTFLHPEDGKERIRGSGDRAEEQRGKGRSPRRGERRDDRSRSRGRRDDRRDDKRGDRR